MFVGWFNDRDSEGGVALLEAGGHTDPGSTSTNDQNVDSARPAAGASPSRWWRFVHFPAGLLGHLKKHSGARAGTAKREDGFGQFIEKTRKCKGVFPGDVAGDNREMGISKAL